MKNIDLPPVPGAGEYGPEVCAIVRLYLAVLDDLSPEQVNLLLKHVSTCPTCTSEFHLMKSTTRLLAGLEATSPSPRVDSAIMAAIAAPAGKRSSKAVRSMYPGRRVTWLVSQVAIAAVILLAILTATHFVGLAPSGHQVFQLPPNLSWSGYVLYHSETKVSTSGMHYRVDSYHDLNEDRMHVETIAGDQLDVVVVGDAHEMLGEDMIHHVAQMGADSWAVDDSAFDLTTLRHALQTNAAVYLDIDRFKGQEVYRIRLQSGLVLLLDMNYRPVNVLRDALGPGTGEPVYDTLKLMPGSEVPASMWDMSVPTGFQMGELPAKPE